METAKVNRVEDFFEEKPEQEVTALEALNRAEIDVQIATAKRYPRSFERSKRRMVEMATIDQETAAGCFYTLKRSGRNGSSLIEGPSIRMAEIAVAAWGNTRYGARIVEEGERFIIAQGVCHDLENNTASTIEVRRRITDKYGKRYSDDMITVTANAACAIAARNAVYKVVPLVYINQACDQAKRVAAGDMKSIGMLRQNMLAAFSKLHVDLPRIMAFLDKPDGGLEDINNADLRLLAGTLTAIRDNETTVDSEFPPIEAKKKASGLDEKLNGNGHAAKPAETKPKADQPAATDPDAQPPAPEEPSIGASADTEAVGEYGEPLTDAPAANTPDLSDFTAFHEACTAAVAGSMDPADFSARFTKACVNYPLKSARSKDNAPGHRKAVLEAFIAGKLNAEGKIEE